MASSPQYRLLNASCLSPLYGFESHPGHVRKDASDLGLGGDYLPATPVSSTSYNWLATTSPQHGIYVTKNEIPNS